MTFRLDSPDHRAAAARVAPELVVLLISHAIIASGSNLLHPSLRVCATIGNNAERLACYDRTIRALESGDAQGSSPLSSEELFGMSPRHLQESPANIGEKREDLTSINAQIIEIRKLRTGYLRIRLENGQIWQQTDGEIPLRLRVGDTVTISRGALGSFRLSTPTKSFARVKRVS